MLIEVLVELWQPFFDQQRQEQCVSLPQTNIPFLTPTERTRPATDISHLKTDERRAVAVWQQALDGFDQTEESGPTETP